MSPLGFGSIKDLAKSLAGPAYIIAVAVTVLCLSLAYFVLFRLRFDVMARII